MRCTLPALMAVAALAGCAFDDGNPWSEMSATLSVTFDDASRAGDEGEIRTSNDYLVDLERFSFTVSSVQLLRYGAAGLTFDPASPPAGYSLCHNGHCHADDGSLVSYEEVVINEAGSSTSAIVAFAPDLNAELTDSDGAVVELACDGSDCELPRGEIHAVELEVTELEFAATVRDRPGATATLDEPISVQGFGAPSMTLTALVEWKVDDGWPLRFRAGIELVITAEIFDGIDWTTHAEPGFAGYIVDEVQAGITEHALLSATVIAD